MVRLDDAHDMSLDRYLVIERPLPCHPHQALPPLPSTRPRRILASPLRLSTNNPPALMSRLRAHAWGVFLAFWRFLLGIIS
ncbi:hypothetical protein BJV77DRAFT_232976, partial [Russula vinacea]